MVIKIQFKIRQATTSIGEVIKIVGGNQLLGNWLPQDGLILETNDGIYPQWVSDKQVLDSSINTLEYKYVTFNPSTQACYWEDIANRTIDLSPYQNEQQYDLMVEDAGFNLKVSDAPGKILNNTASSRKPSFVSGRVSQGSQEQIPSKTPSNREDFQPILDLDDMEIGASLAFQEKMKMRTSNVNPLDQAQEIMQVENQQQKLESFLNSQKSIVARVDQINLSQKCDTTNPLEAKSVELASFVGNSIGVTFESNSGPSCKIEEIEEFETTVGLLKDALRECLSLPDWITRSHIQLFYNGNPLADDNLTLCDSKIKEGSKINYLILVA